MKSTHRIINLGGAGWVFKHSEFGFVSAFGGWTMTEDNASVFDSKEQAANAGQSLLSRTA